MQEHLLEHKAALEVGDAHSRMGQDGTGHVGYNTRYGQVVVPAKWEMARRRV